MPNTRHKLLTGDDLHEPKGVESANSGDVYIADGLGSGAWSQALQYANINTIESDTLSVGTIGTTPLTFPFVNNGPDNVITADAANNQIVCDTAGTYMVSFSCSLRTNAAGDAGLYEFKLLDDGAETGFAAEIELSGSSDTDSISFVAMLNVGAASVLTIQVESDEVGNTDDITVYTASLSALRLGA